MRNLRYIFVFYVSALLIGCGGGGGGSGSSNSDSGDTGADTVEPTEESLPSPADLNATYSGYEITISWDASVVDAEQFNVYHAEETITDIKNYAAFEGGALIQNAQSPLTVTVDSLAPVYHFRVTQVVDTVESAPSDEVKVIPRYEIVNSGTQVRDLINNLLWDRCRHGKTWDPSTGTCSGDAIAVSYDGARVIATSRGMRIPTQREFMSLSYCSANEPSYFPADLDEFVSVTGSPCNTRSSNEFPAIFESVFRNEHPSLVMHTSTGCVDWTGRQAISFSRSPASVCYSGDTGLFLRLAKDI